MACIIFTLLTFIPLPHVNYWLEWLDFHVLPHPLPFHGLVVLFMWIGLEKSCQFLEGSLLKLGHVFSTLLWTRVLSFGGEIQSPVVD